MEYVEAQTAIAKIMRLNQHNQNLCWELQDARAWARLWKRAAKHQFIMGKVLTQCYKSSDELLGEYTAELAQARETIVLMSEAALSQQQEIARLKERLEAWIDWAIIVGQKGPDHDA